jgi:glycosyltransferase involved in cell wall biosynthesis
MAVSEENAIKFSVVVPTYNRAGLIPKTLDSILTQTYGNYEIIVVDNGSTDNTLEVLRPYEEKSQIMVIRNPVNQERCVSRNLGMKAATGDFLTLLDSDDLMHPDNLKDAAVFIRNNPRYLFFHNFYQAVNDKGEVTYRQKKIRSNKHAVRSISYGNFIACIGVFLAKEIYEAYKFDENPAVIGSEDWELWIRILARYPLGRIKKINNSILEHISRSTLGFSVESIMERRKYIIDKIKSTPELKAVYGKYLNVMMASGYVFSASTANGAGLYQAARGFIREALRYNPLLLFDLPFLRIIQVNAFRTVFAGKG